MSDNTPTQKMRRVRKKSGINKVKRELRNSRGWEKTSGVPDGLWSPSWATGPSSSLEQHLRSLQETRVMGTAPSQTSGSLASGIRDADKSSDNCSLAERNWRRNSCSAFLFVREIWRYHISSIILPLLPREGLFLLLCHFHNIWS